MLIEPANGAQQTHGKLGAGHFHAEHGDRLFSLERNVLGDVEREGGFAHGRPSGYNDQIARLQARRALVEIGKAGGDASDIRRIVAAIKHVDALDDLR